MKKLVSAILALALGAAASAQPANDNCANAIPITSGSIVTANLVGATRDGVLTCWNFANTREVWYTYTAAGVEDVTASLCDSVWAATSEVSAVAAYQGCGGAQLACSRTEHCGTAQPQITFQTTGPGVYLIAVAKRSTTGTQTATLSLSATPVSGAVPDSCASALPFAGDRLVAFNTAGLTTDGTATCGGTNDGWYLWTPTHTGTGVVTTCGFTAGDTVLSAFSACGGSELACNDNVCGSASQISFPITAQTPVLVRIATADGQAASGQILFARPETVPPTNDTCANAEIVPGLGSYFFDGRNATTQGPSAACGVGGRPDTHDVYFRYTPSADGWITADTTQADPVNYPDTTLQILDACGGNVLRCSDNATIGGIGNGSLTCPLFVTGGTPYILRVAAAGAGSAGVKGYLRLSSASGPIVYQRPAGALPEPAVCGALPPEDDINLGCNPTISPTFQRATTISGVCDTYYGQAPMLVASPTSNPLDGYYDADAYVFTLAAPDVLTITGQAQFVGNCSLDSACGDYSPSFSWGHTWMNPECGAGNFTVVSYPIPAGRVMLRIQNYGDPSATCGHNDEYWFHISSASSPCTGACCNGTTCSSSAQADCTGSFQGVGTTCGPVGNPTTCCPANFDGANGLQVADIFSFLSAWFAGAAAADFDHAGGLQVSDIFTFLNAWFAGC